MQSVDELNTLVLAGGRGGGKSILLIWLIGYFALISGEAFNAVLIRRDLAGLSKLEDLLYQQVPTLMPGSKYFKAKRQWRLSNGGTLRLIHMDANDAFNKIQGEDLSHIFWDELGQEGDPQVVLRARSSMRTTDPTVVPNFIATAKPLGPGSWWIRDYVVTKALPNRIFNCEFFGAQPAVWVKSTLRDNHLANPDAYEQELRASCFGDESKNAAEVLGEWGQVTAGFFGSCLSIERSMLPRDFQVPWRADSDGVFRQETKAQLAALAETQKEMSPQTGTSGLQKTSSVPQRRITIQARWREYQVLDPAYYELSPDQQSAYLDALDGAG